MEDYCDMVMVPVIITVLYPLPLVAYVIAVELYFYMLICISEPEPGCRSSRYLNRELCCRFDRSHPTCIVTLRGREERYGFSDTGVQLGSRSIRARLNKSY